jgi:hypothetical protein
VRLQLAASRADGMFRIQAEVAQLVEQLIRNQQVTGSSPVFGSTFRELLSDYLSVAFRYCSMVSDA